MGIQSSHFAHVTIPILAYMPINLPGWPSYNKTRAFHPVFGMDKGRGVTSCVFCTHYSLFPVVIAEQLKQERIVPEIIMTSTGKTRIGKDGVGRVTRLPSMKITHMRDSIPEIAEQASLFPTYKSEHFNPSIKPVF